MTKSSAVLLLVGGALSLAACSSGSTGNGSSASMCPAKASPADFPGFPGLPGADAGATGTPGTTGTTGGGITEVTSFGENPGGLKMYVHAPSGGKAVAVVVALHGCTQGASDYVGAGWNDLADKAGFAVVYAEQNTTNNFQRCFRWFDKTQIERGAGEAASIAAMTKYAMSQYGATHAYVTGLSAGAAMTAVMLATYSDLFEAGAIMAGLPYACATSQNDAYTCMNPGRDQTADAWAALVPAAAKGSAPRVSIWAGDADYIVSPKNETELVRQWAGVAGVPSDKPSSTDTVDGASHAEYKDSSGVVRVESWTIKGMGHGVALAPKAGCGTAAAYMLDEGVCSTTKAAAFFGLVAGDGTPTNPATSSSSSGTTSGGNANCN